MTKTMQLQAQVYYCKDMLELARKNIYSPDSQTDHSINWHKVMATYKGRLAAASYFSEMLELNIDTTLNR